MWFPRPEQADDIEILSPDPALEATQIYPLLHNAGAREWKEKVGVAAFLEGSAKVTVRLLESQGWFCKTDKNLRTEDRKQLKEAVLKAIQLQQQYPLWHPKKLYFLMRIDRFWWPMSLCPTLKILRQITTWQERLQWQKRMLKMGLEYNYQHQLGLDLNPSNFGFSPDDEGTLYYVDDEVYPQQENFHFASALVARIPEESQIQKEDWFDWGIQLQDVFSPYIKQAQWLTFFEDMRQYPLVSTLEDKREALIQGFCKGQPFLDPEERRRLRKQKKAAAAIAPKKSGWESGKITCIFADVHGNLPALNAVLKTAKQYAVDSYLFLGDVVGYGPFPKQCIQKIRELDNAILLKGNHDQSAATGELEDGMNRLAKASMEWTHQQLSQDERDWLLHLPTDYNGDTWSAVHGAPIDKHRYYAYIYEFTYRNNLQFLEDHNIQTCFYGHSHIQFIYRRLNGKDESLFPKNIKLFQENEYLLLNPGSVGQPRDRDPNAAFAIWNREKNIVTFLRVGYPVEETMEEIIKQGLPEDLAARLEMGW